MKLSRIKKAPVTKALTFDQKQELLRDLTCLTAHESAFASEEDKKRAWFAHRDKLIKEYSQERPGERS